MRQYRQLVVAALLLLSLFGMAPLRAEEPPAQQPLVVFAVRHAEKANTGDKDPDLTVAGRLRAAQLAVLLRNSGIQYVHSSCTNRTRSTAEPTADALGLKVKIYDAADVPSLVEKLQKTGGRHLVVGHSNTTPDTVEKLKGDSGRDIDEKTEFDRLYVVTVGADGAVSTLMLRYGAPSLIATSE